MAEQEEDYSTLPIETRATHKVHTLFFYYIFFFHLTNTFPSLPLTINLGLESPIGCLRRYEKFVYKIQPRIR